MGSASSTADRQQPAQLDRNMSTRSKAEEKIHADNERVSRLVQAMTAHPKKRRYGPLMTQADGEQFDGYKVRSS